MKTTELKQSHQSSDDSIDSSTLKELDFYHKRLHLLTGKSKISTGEFLPLILDWKCSMDCVKYCDLIPSVRKISTPVHPLETQSTPLIGFTVTIFLLCDWYWTDSLVALWQCTIYSNSFLIPCWISSMQQNKPAVQSSKKMIGNLISSWIHCWWTSCQTEQLHSCSAIRWIVISESPSISFLGWNSPSIWDYSNCYLKVISSQSLDRFQVASHLWSLSVWSSREQLSKCWFEIFVIKCLINCT